MNSNEIPAPDTTTQPDAFLAFDFGPDTEDLQAERANYEFQRECEIDSDRLVNRYFEEGF